MAADTRALVSLTEIKQYLEIDSEDTGRDALLTAMVNSATDVIERFCSCYFVEYEVATIEIPEKHDGTGTDECYTDYYPIRSITQLRDNPYTGTARVLSPTDYLLYADEGRIKLRTDSQTLSRFSSAPQSIEIAYKVGYCADTASVPHDVKAAAKQLIAVWYRDRAGDLTTERIGDYTWQRSPAWREPTDLPDQVKFLLGPYIRYRVGAV